MPLGRFDAAKLGLETVQIITKGSYLSANGKLVDIKAQIAKAKAGVRAYPPGESPTIAVPTSAAGISEVRNETTLHAGKRLLEAGLRPVALNFASAKSPGGGFLSGARAQEESLARASALYATLNGHDFYNLHRRQGGSFYTDYTLYSPDVPIFLSEDGALLDEPWTLSFITAAAPNAKGHGLPLDAATKAQFLAAFETRLRKVMFVALENGHDSIVLGAWGCGAFGNQPSEVVPVFARLMSEEFPHAFARVVWAVLDNSADKATIGPFEAAFGQ